MVTVIGGYNPKNKMIWNNDEGTKIVKDHVKNIRTKDKEFGTITISFQGGLINDVKDNETRKIQVQEE